jgi:hypothetical protein
MKRAWVVALVLLCSSMAFSLDRDVKKVATALQQQYGVKFHKLPLIARIVMKPALWGKGVKVDIVTFEGFSPDRTNLEQIESAMKDALGSDWSWFIRSTSKKTHERAVMYVRGVGDSFDMMIVSIEPSEAEVVKVRLKPNEMKKWMDEPDEMVRHGDSDKQREKKAAKEERKQKNKDKQQDKDRSDEQSAVAEVK